MGMFSDVLPSSPVASSFAGFPRDMDDWNCEQWKQYYIRNKAALGQTQAVSILNSDSYRISIFADVHSCPYDCDWANYMAGQGMDPSNIFSMVYCGGTKVVKNVVDATVDTSQVLSNVTNKVSKFTGSSILMLVLLGGIAYVGYNKFAK